MKTVFSLVAVLAWATPALSITVSTVPVGYRGNANDPGTGGIFGSVNYSYRIGTTEVTVGQYTAFLNAVASTDTYGLYNPVMAFNENGSVISRDGSPGSYTYNVIGSPNLPVAYTNWGDAARFCNWLHNGQPTGSQTASTTEGGAYSLNGAETNAALQAVTRSTDAQWFIPSENEWYKAAYYQPSEHGGDADGYWTYPTRTNASPNSDQPPGAPAVETNVANIFSDDSLPNGYNDGFAVTGETTYLPTEHYATDAAAYTQSGSFFKTFDQGGNVHEWNETTGLADDRGFRGGYWADSHFNLRASNRAFAVNLTENWFIGFRVAAVQSVPEPSAVYLMLATAFATLAIRQRKPVPQDHV